MGTVQGKRTVFSTCLRICRRTAVAHPEPTRCWASPCPALSAEAEPIYKGHCMKWHHKMKASCRIYPTTSRKGLSKIAAIEKLLSIFEENNLHPEGDTIPIPTPLCKGHYHTLYSSVQPQQSNCPTCGMSLKHVKCRPCTNAEVVWAHLWNSASYEGNSSTGDEFCFKYHLILL